MAGPTVKEILLKWGIDVSSWRRAIADINTLLEQQQSKAAKAQQDYLDTLDDQKASVKELIGLQQDLTEELQRQAQIRSQTKTDDSGAKRATHEKSTTDHIRSQVTAHKDVQDSAEESGKIAAQVAKQQKLVTEEIKKQSVEIRTFIAAQKSVQSELASTLKQEQLVTQEIKKQVSELQKLSQLRAPTAWKPTYVSTAPAPVARATPPTQAPAASWQADMAKLQGGLATGALAAGSDQALKLNKQIREELEKRMAVLRQIPNLTNAEVAEVNKLRAAYTQLNRAAHPPSKKEGNFFTEFASGFTSRFAGTLAFAVFSAEGLGRILETLTMKMKEFVESTGPLTQVREQFEKLATTQNVNPTKFIEDLRTATKGLVNDTTLYRTANQAMQSGLGTSSDKIVELTQATVGLARANGRDAKEALEALDMFMTTGYARTLGRVTGLQSSALAGVRSLGGGFDQSTRLLLNFNEAAELVIRQYKAIGEPALTYTDRLTQLQESQHRFGEELALSLQKSAGFQKLLDYMGEAAKKIDSLTEGVGSWGEALGVGAAAVADLFRATGAAAGAFLDVLNSIVKIGSDLIGIFSSDAASKFSTRFTTLAGVLGTIDEILILISAGFKEMGNVITWVGEHTVPGLKMRLLELASTLPVVGTVIAHFFADTIKQTEAQVKAANDSFFAREKILADEMGRKLADAEKLWKGQTEVDSKVKYRITFAAPDTSQTELQVLESEKRMAKVREELRLKSSQTILVIAESQIKAEESLLQSQREAGLVSDADYYSKKMGLENERFEAVMKNLKEEHAAKQEFNRADTAMDLLAAKVEKGKALKEAETETASIQKQLEDQLRELHGEKNPVVASNDQLADKVQEQTKATIENTAALRGEKAPAEAAKTKPLAGTASQLVAGIKQPELTGTASELIKGIKETPEVIEARLNSSARAYIEQIKARLATALALVAAKEKEARAKSEIENQDALARETKAYEEHLQKQLAPLNEELKAELAVRKTYDEAAADIDKHKIELQKSINEDAFKNQTISAVTYLNKKKDIIEQEFTATEHAEARKRDEAGKTEQALATYNRAILDAKQKQELELTKLDQDQWDIRTGAEEKGYANTQKLLDAQLSYQKQLAPFIGEKGSNKAQAETLREIVSFTQQKLELQEKELSQMKEINADWYTQQERVLKTKEEMLKYNEELIKAQAPLQGLSSFASNLAEGFSALRGKGMQAIGQDLSQFAQRITAIQKQASERAMVAQEHGGGFLAQFGIGRRTISTTPISAADREKALGQTLGNVDQDMKGVDAQSKGLVDAIDGTKSSVTEWSSQITNMAATVQKAIDAINAKIASTVEQSNATRYSQESEIKPGETGDVLPRTPDSLLWFQSKPPQLAIGGTVVGGGIAEVHTGEQVSPVSEVMAMVTAAKAAAEELTRFTTNLDALTKVLSKVGAGPFSGQPRGTAPPPAERVQAATSSVLKSAISGILGGPRTPAIGTPIHDAAHLTFPEKLFGAPRLQGQTLTQWMFGQIPKAPTVTVKPPTLTDQTRAFASEAGLSGAPTATTPLGLPTKSDLGDANQTLSSLTRADLTSGADAARQAQNAALVQNIGVTEQSTQATAADTQATQTNAGALGGNTSLMGGLSSALGSATQIVGGFQNALSGAGGPAKSALAGAQAGLQLGSMIPGPAGMVIGGVAAGVGAILGVFSGKARDHTEQIAKRLEAAFAANTAEVQNGSQTLKGGIDSAQALITTTVQELTGQKGGKQIMESVLPQMDQALAQLKQQQQQILQAFHDKLQIASAPIAYQDSLGQIQGIIQQYQQYIQAGGSVANANQFLQQSFQTLAQNGINQLNQSEQDAINNALNYNDLLRQRQDLIQNTNLQIQQIMSQGVAVRQVPQGVTKAAQIEQVVRQATEQQQNLDQQISVSKYKLDNEQKIYNLATTRVGLEQQLVLLQNQQTNLQLESTEALGNVINAMKTALPTSMPAALAQLGLGAAYVPPEAAQAPTPPIKTGIKSVDLQNELEYQQELAYYQQQQNLPVGYINPAGSPAGTEQTGTAGGIYTGPTPGVPTTSPYPSTIGKGFSQDQINKALDIIKGGKVGQPLNPPPDTTIGIGTGLPGPTPLLTPASSQAADIVSTPDGQAMLVTQTRGSFAAPTSAVRTLTGGGAGGGGGTTALPPNLALYGTDSGGNPVYSDANGNLFNAGGQSVGSIGAPAITDIKVYRPQPQPGGGGPPAGPITFPTPPGGGKQVIGPPPSLAPQIPGQGGVPGTGIQGVTVNADGSLSFSQLPSTVLTTVNVGTGPGTTQDVGVVGSPAEVQAAITPTFAQLEGTVVPTIVEPQPPPPAPIFSTGQPEPPGTPPVPVIPQPPTPAPIDVSALVAALEAAVSGDVKAEQKTMNDFIAILENIDSVGLTATIAALQAFHDKFKKNHSGPQSRASQGAMQVVINELQQMANSQPPEVLPLPAQPAAPVSTAPTTGIGTVTGLPTFPSLPTSPIITPPVVVSGGTFTGVAPTYRASNTGGGGASTGNVNGIGGTPVNMPTLPTSPIITPPVVTGGGTAPANPQLQATAQAELPKVMAMSAQFNAILAQYAAGQISGADALKQLTAIRDNLSVELEMIPSMGYLFSNVEGQMNQALASIALKTTAAPLTTAFTVPTTATFGANTPGYSATTFQLTPEQGQQVQQILNSEMADLNAIIVAYNNKTATADQTNTALNAFQNKYNSAATSKMFGGATYPFIALGQQDQPIWDKYGELMNITLAQSGMSLWHTPFNEQSGPQAVATPTLQDVLTQPVPTNMLSLSTNSLTFGPQSVGTTSAPQTVGIGTGTSPVGTPTSAANQPTALELAAWAAGIPTRAGVPDSPVPGFPTTGTTAPVSTAVPTYRAANTGGILSDSTRPVDTVPTSLGQAMLVTDGNPPTASSTTTTAPAAPTPNAPAPAPSGGSTFTLSQTPTSPMPTTAPAPGMFWAWAGSSWQQEPSAAGGTPAPTAPTAGPTPAPTGGGTIPPMPTTPLDNFQVWKWNGTAWAPAPSGYWEGTAPQQPIGPIAPVSTPPTAPTPPEPAPPWESQPYGPPTPAGPGWATPPANPTAGQTFTMPDGVVVQWVPPHIGNVDSVGIGSIMGEVPGQWKIISLPTPQPPVTIPTNPTTPPTGFGGTTTKPQPVGAPNWTGAPNQTWTDPQGNVWNFVPPVIWKGGDITSITPGYWQLASQATPTPPTLPTSPISAPPPTSPAGGMTTMYQNFGVGQVQVSSTGQIYQGGKQIGTSQGAAGTTWSNYTAPNITSLAMAESDSQLAEFEQQANAIVATFNASPKSYTDAVTAQNALSALMKSMWIPGQFATGIIGGGTDLYNNIYELWNQLFAVAGREAPLSTTPPPPIYGGPVKAWGFPLPGSPTGGLPTSPIITPSPVTPTGGAPTSPMSWQGIAPPATPADQSVSVNFTDPQGNVWRWNPPFMATGGPEGGGVVGWVPGEWMPISLVPVRPPATSPVVTPSPVTAGPTKLQQESSGERQESLLATAPTVSATTPIGTTIVYPQPLGPATWNGTKWVFNQAAGVLSAVPTASSFLSSTLRSFMPPPAVTAAGGSVSPTVAGTAMAHVNAQLSATTQRVTLENQINSLSSTRVAAETQLVSLKMQEIQADMQRVAAHQNLLATIRSTASSGSALEDLMNNLYQTRSRQGFGGFTGEISNPV